VADWRAQNRSFESIGAHGFALLNLTAAGQPDALCGARVSADLLPLLGVPPSLGRYFLPAEDQPGRDQGSFSATICGSSGLPATRPSWAARLA